MGSSDPKVMVVEPKTEDLTIIRTFLSSSAGLELAVPFSRWAATSFCRVRTIFKPTTAREVPVTKRKMIHREYEVVMRALALYWVAGDVRMAETPSRKGVTKNKTIMNSPAALETFFTTLREMRLPAKVSAGTM